MKAAGHPVPSGDREMARALLAALQRAGHEVETACRLRSYDGLGDPERQARLGAIGRRLAQRLAGRYRRRSAATRPRLWFTYHLYHKAPDWLGPAVSRTLGIPYVVAEASHGSKQATGPWAAGHHAAAAAIAAADRIFGLNPADAKGILPLLRDPGSLVPMAPFIDHDAFADAADRREGLRLSLARDHCLDPGVPWLLTVAMMRPGAKLASFRILGEALGCLKDRPWHLLVVGDGPARADVERALAPLGERVRNLGERDRRDLPGIYAGADLYLWPAVNEAFGVAFLEAQAAGLPVVAGRTGGVGEVVTDGETGLLVPVGDPARFARSTAALLDDSDRRHRMGRAAQTRIGHRHSLATAAALLDRELRALAGDGDGGEPRP